MEKRLQVGLGEAIMRLIDVESRRRNGISKIPEQSIAERNLIVEALNEKSVGSRILIATEMEFPIPWRYSLSQQKRAVVESHLLKAIPQGDKNHAAGDVNNAELHRIANYVRRLLRASEQGSMASWQILPP